MATYETRISHLTFHRDGGRFIITSERDEDFEREVKIGPVISSTAKRSKGNPFGRIEEIHKTLYGPAVDAYKRYQKGDAPATGELEIDRDGDSHPGKGKGKN